MVVACCLAGDERCLSGFCSSSDSANSDEYDNRSLTTKARAVELSSLRSPIMRTTLIQLHSIRRSIPSRLRWLTLCSSGTWSRSPAAWKPGPMPIDAIKRTSLSLGLYHLKRALYRIILRPYKVIGKTRWAIRFSRWYRLSLKREHAIARLLPIVARCFEHKWVASVELKLRPFAGCDTVLGKKVPERPMHLDAPVTVTVLRERKRKKRQAFCMSFYVSRNIIYVVQLQGVRGQDVPVELRSWPVFLVASLQKLACNEKFKEIRVAKARTLGSYRYPDAKGTARETIEQIVARIRKNMQSHYDGTARALGFIERRRWWVWRTPKCCVGSCCNRRVARPGRPLASDGRNCTACVTRAASKMWR